MTVDLHDVYIPSDEIVAREIEGELIIVPLAAGIGDMEDELFSLNETGREIWARLDGQHSLAAIVAELMQAYDAPRSDIEQDVRGLAEELASRRIIKVVG
jgi:coenzyme PQQ biosynthesis protein PqqD